jgi:hypothetical protein
MRQHFTCRDECISTICGYAGAKTAVVSSEHKRDSHSTRPEVRQRPPRSPGLAPMDCFSFGAGQRHEKSPRHRTRTYATFDHSLLQKCGRRLNIGLTFPESFMALTLNVIGFRNTFWVNLSGGLASQLYPKRSVSN